MERSLLLEARGLLPTRSSRHLHRPTLRLDLRSIPLNIIEALLSDCYYDLIDAEALSHRSYAPIADMTDLERATVQENISAGRQALRQRVQQRERVIEEQKAEIEQLKAAVRSLTRSERDSAIYSREVPHHGPPLGDEPRPPYA